MTKNKHYKTSRYYPARYMWQSVSMDLIGPFSETSIGGARFSLTIIDRFSGYIYAYPIKSKTEVLDKFREFLAEEHITRTPPQTVMTDWGTEFEDPFRSWARRKGIKLRRSCPYTAHENGLVEAANKELQHVARAIQKRANMPEKFWGHAIDTAAYIINRISTRSNPGAISPYEMKTWQKPDLSNMRIYGCAAEVFVEKVLRNKSFGPSGDHSRTGVFLGYAHMCKGYVFYIEELDRVVIRKTADFDEGHLPYSATPDIRTWLQEPQES